MRQVWAEQSWPGARSSTHVLPVASEECAPVKVETQGLFSNICRFSALLLIPLASPLRGRTGASTGLLTRKEMMISGSSLTSRLGQCRLCHHGTISPQRARHQVDA